MEAAEPFLVISLNGQGVFCAHSSVGVPSSWGGFLLLSQVLCHAACQNSDTPLSRLCSLLSTVCKYVAVELKSAFEETGKTKEVIDTKYGFLDGKGSAVKYTQS